MTQSYFTKPSVPGGGVRVRAVVRFLVLTLTTLLRILRPNGHNFMFRYGVSKKRLIGFFNLI